MLSKILGRKLAQRGAEHRIFNKKECKNLQVFIELKILHTYSNS